MSLYPNAPLDPRAQRLIQAGPATWTQSDVEHIMSQEAYRDDRHPQNVTVQSVVADFFTIQSTNEQTQSAQAASSDSICKGLRTDLKKSRRKINPVQQ